MVTGVKKHQIQPMAFVSFQSPDFAKAVLEFPPPTVGGVSVMPVKQHQSDPSSIVLRWHGQIGDLTEDAIAADFDALFGQCAPDPAASVVSSVKKHALQPMAYVNFWTAEHAQMMLNSPPASLGEVPVLPAMAHRADPSTVVLRWCGHRDLLSEEAIASCVDALFSASLEEPQFDDVASAVVAQVKKHRLQPMAFVTFYNEEIARNVLEAPPTEVCGLSVLPVKPHQSDPTSVVLRWHGQNADLSEQDIAVEFDTVFSHEFADADDGGWMNDSTCDAIVPSSIGLGSGGIGSSGSSVVEIRKHAVQPMAYVIFTDAQTVAAVLMSPPSHIAGVSVLPVKAHQKNPCAVVLRWQGHRETLSDDTIATGFEEYLEQQPSQAVLLQSSPRVVGACASRLSFPIPKNMSPPVLGVRAVRSIASQHLDIGTAQEGVSVVAVQKHRHLPMAYVTFHTVEMAKAVLEAPPAVIGGVPVLPAKPHASDPSSVVLRWQGGHGLSENLLAAAFNVRPPVQSEVLSKPAVSIVIGPRRRPPATASFPISGTAPAVLGVPAAAALPAPACGSARSVVLDVRRHSLQPMSYVTFATQELAQSVLRDPPQTVAGVEILPAQPHKSNQRAIVIRWLGDRGTLTEDTIAAEFEALFAGEDTKDGLPYVEPACVELSAGGFHHVVRVKKHEHQPMAFVTFQSAAVAQVVLSDPPANVCGFSVLPMMPHNTDPTSVVIRWRGAQEDLSEEMIASELDAMLCASEPQVVRPRDVGRQLIGQSPPAGVKRRMEFEEEGSPFVALVKKHWQQPMAYVSFRSAEIAQAVLSCPPEAVGGMVTLPAKPHQTDPQTVVLRWQGACADLTEEEIAAEFNVAFAIDDEGHDALDLKRFRHVDSVT